MSRFIFIFIFSTILSTILVQSAFSIDPQFEACQPKSCGNGLNISFPFWIPGQHKSYCGHPQFQVTCNVDHKPILSMSYSRYVVRNISYHNLSFLVANTDELNETSCPIPRHNVSDIVAPFEYGPNHINLYLFYNCTSVPKDYPIYPIDCEPHMNPSGRSFAAFLHDEGLEYVNASRDSCDSMVTAPVDMDGEDMLANTGYLEILRRGFSLEWAPNNCSKCARSGGHCGFENDKFICFCRDRPQSISCGKKLSRTTKIAIGVGTGAGVILMVCIFYLIRRRRRLLSKSSALISRDITLDSSSKPDLENGGSYFQTPIFSYDELEEATNNFDSSKELGDGGFGTVYHGKLKDGRVVAVKRLYENNYKRVEQFMNEIAILSRLRHCNLVSLYGCTSRHSRELLLVYEFVPNGTVADHLHGERAKSGLLTWSIRMGIAIESADALSYLHASDTIHRDVKTNNILLDNNFHVKVADFGLSRLFPTDATHVSTAPQGTPGYVDPEYYQCYQLNDKSDVYSFGVVLIELISAKPAVDITRHRHEINLSNMAINKIHNDALHELVDPSLGFESNYNTKRMITMVAELAFRCLQQEKDMRPSMNEVLEALKEIENEQYKAEKEKEKAEEVDLPADARLLKNIQPLSPNTVTDKWVSNSTTPNTSA